MLELAVMLEMWYSIVLPPDLPHACLPRALAPAAAILLQAGLQA
jgi:hypothetical protein